MFKLVLVFAQTDGRAVASCCKIVIAPMAAITQKPLPCDEKQRLYKDMVLAIVELKRLHESEIDALLSGRVQRKDLSRFDVAIQRASAQREAAKQAYLRHVFEHKC